MPQGRIADIREFTVHDGPGIRTTVFLKGCPLRCTWCHNPEMQCFAPQEIHAAGSVRMIGTDYEPAALAAILNRQAPILRANDGGVTFSGGEPLSQALFVSEVIDRLHGLHVTLDTSGHASAEDFQCVVSKCQLVYYDLKLIDAEEQRRFTGLDNTLILSNLRHLSRTGVPFVIRVPLIPGVTDSKANLSAIARTAQGLPGLLRVDLLPYNRAAGGKYAAFGMTFHPGFDESAEPNADIEPFRILGVPVHVARGRSRQADAGAHARS